jgi:hypothetical protein
LRYLPSTPGCGRRALRSAATTLPLLHPAPALRSPTCHPACAVWRGRRLLLPSFLRPTPLGLRAARVYPGLPTCSRDRPRIWVPLAAIPSTAGASCSSRAFFPLVEGAAPYATDISWGRSTVLNDATPDIKVDPETYQVRAPHLRARRGPDDRRRGIWVTSAHGSGLIGTGKYLCNLTGSLQCGRLLLDCAWHWRGPSGNGVTCPETERGPHRAG